MSPAVWRLALNAGGAGRLRRDFGFSGSHFPNEKKLNPAALTNKLALQVQQHLVRPDILEHARTCMTALNMLCESVMPKMGFIRKSLIIKMVGAEGLEPPTYSV